MIIAADDSLIPPAFDMDRVRSDGAPVESDVTTACAPERDAGANQDRGRRRRRRGGRAQEAVAETAKVEAEAVGQAKPVDQDKPVDQAKPVGRDKPVGQDNEAKTEEGGEQKSRRRRGRRGGRRRARPDATTGTENQPRVEAAGTEGAPPSEGTAEITIENETKATTPDVTPEAKAETGVASEATAAGDDAQAEAKPKPRRRRRSPRTRRPKAAEQTEASEPKASNGEDATVMVADRQKPAESAPTQAPTSELDTQPFVPVSALARPAAASEATAPSPKTAPVRRRRSAPKAVDVVAAPEAPSDDGGEPRRGWWNRILP